ncbi:MAG: BMP family protein [Deltaproteobacteria bacterium]|nr:BMP family protein [Deltaproteobacteria bacterium]
MSRRVAVLLFSLPLLLWASGCHRNPQQTTPDKFRVALLIPGPVSDAGWNALAYEGLIRIRDTLHAEVSQVETKTPVEFEEAFRDYASRGFHLVFGHGFEFQDAAARVGADFPQTVFITTSGSTVRQNVAPMRFLLEEATYLMGMMSAMLSRTGKAGAIGGIEIPPLKSTFMAFAAGAKSVKPDFQVVVSYIGNWEDAGAARQAALALIEQGCDIIIPNADAASLGAFQAAQEKKVLAFGTNKNQNGVAPDVIMASGVIDIPAAFLQVAQEVNKRTFHGRIMRLGMKEGVITLAYNPALQDRLPPEVQARVAAAKQQIVTGALAVPSVEFTPFQAGAS